jgi:hypothetical protein
VRAAADRRWVAIGERRRFARFEAMNRLLIIICVILVALILSSLSLYRLCLSKSDIQQHYDPRGQRIEKIAEQALA